ncbi:Permease of the major facilitator superfamily [Candidatus Burkholderia humilis]|nr:Permease of the major facilitator superfamily [Candidatus Burkholderia humilis]
MNTINQVAAHGPQGFFSKEATIAKPGFSRWMVPPAALAVHLCIGQAYAFSVFNAPMTKVIGITQSAPDDWSLTTLGWIFSLAIVFLGLSAAFAGKWLEKVGPRRTMFTAACRFGGGFLVSALGVYLHQIALLYLGYGVIGGIGLGLGVLYFISMTIGALAIRIPPKDWKPAGWTPLTTANKMITKNHVHIDQALKTPQFYLLWLVLNVTAGIGVLGQASVMIQESFKSSITAGAAAGFVGLLSLFNMGGRFVWASASDWIGRKNTYFVFFVLGAVPYFLVPQLAGAGNIALFVLAYGIILSMYGGGFSTIPAYFAGMFGTAFVGGIHGRLLTAWAAAGIAGPVLVNYVRAFQVAHGVTGVDAYTMDAAHHGGAARHRIDLQSARHARAREASHEPVGSGR